MLLKISIVFLAAVSAFLGIYLRSTIEFTTFDLLLMSLFLLSALSIEVLLIWLIWFVARTPSAVSIAAGAAIVLNIYCLRGALMGNFTSFPTALQIAFLLGGVFVMYTLLSAIDEGGVSRRMVLGLVGLLVVADLVPALIIWQQSAAAAVKSTDRESAVASPNLRLVKFARKQNVYIAAFDSLMPRSLARKHLGTSRFAYHDILEKRFRLFPNMFADAVPTRQSLNSILALDPEYYHGAKQNHTLFSGHVPSPLFQIFKYNGYTTNTVFISRYFGLTKGPHVDNYSFFKQASTLCDFIDTHTNYLDLLWLLPLRQV